MNRATRRIPRRFFLTSGRVVCDLAEVEAWIEERRRATEPGPTSTAVAMLNRVAPSRERDELIATNERLEIFLYHLPENIAARGPFKDQDHVYQAAMAEVRRVLPLLEASQNILQTSGAA
jgi:hypothetical protein